MHSASTSNQVGEVMRTSKAGYALFAMLAVACSLQPEIPAQKDKSEPRVDAVEIVDGVPDRGVTPSVVALLIDGSQLCSGTLIAPNAVLTARHCVSKTRTTLSCPSGQSHVLGERSPDTISVIVGETVGTGHEVAVGAESFVPSGDSLCDADIAVLVLDQPVLGVAHLGLSKGAPKKTGTLRVVGFGKRGELEDAGRKYRRDQVAIRSVTTAEFEIGEGTCQGDSGGPALDEISGQVLGVLSRGGPTCEGATTRNIFTRVDAFKPLLDRALLAAEKRYKNGLAAPEDRVATKPPDEIGVTCESGNDCATGVCVRTEDEGYCSRRCGTGTRCPNGFQCKPFEGGISACVAKPPVSK